MIENNNINLVFVGHTNSGKSTLAGNLIYYYKSSIKMDYFKMENILHKSIIDGQDSNGKFSNLFYLDEKEILNDTTINLNVIDTIINGRNFAIIDSPGNLKRKKILFNALNLSDYVCFVVSIGKCQSKTHKTTKQEIKEFVYLLYSYGVKKMIIIVNKMDKVDYSETEYISTLTNLSFLLNSAGFSYNDFNFIPCNSLSGENIFFKSENMPWYKGETLQNILFNLDTPERDLDSPLKIYLSKCYLGKTYPFYKIFCAKVLKGKLKLNESIININNEKIVVSLQIFTRDVNEVIAGDYCGIKVIYNTYLHDILKTGVMLDNSIQSELSLNLKNEFFAEITLLQHRLSKKEKYDIIFFYDSFECKIISVESKIDKKTKQIVENNPIYLNIDETFIVKILTYNKINISNDKKNFTIWAYKENILAVGEIID